MAGWNEILKELRKAKGLLDEKRHKYISQLHELTGRNVVAYYSGWLQKPHLSSNNFSIQDSDKNSFMAAFKGLDFDKGLDLVVHTPGGDIAATESIINYLRSKFGNDIRVIVPQLAMSGGTLIACSSKKILMGNHSSLGPVDPQMNGLPAHGVVEEFERAKDEINSEGQSAALVWQTILNKYPPTFLGECEKAIDWSEEILENSLREVMFEGDDDVDEKVERIVNELSDHVVTKSHSRHLSAMDCKEMGLKVDMIEEDQELQDAVLSVHHVMVHNLSPEDIVKITANHNDQAYIQKKSG